MRTQATDSLAAWPADLVPPRGVLVLSGYGLDIRVWRGRLRVADGIGHDRREGLIHRATGRLKRLVVLGHTGAISLEAIRWLADVGAGYTQIDADGRVLAAFGPLGTDRPGLRRAQARALDTTLGNDIARRLIAEKVAGQAETLAGSPHYANVTDATLAILRDASTRLHVAATRDDVRLAEAMAAGAYWSALAPISVRFARQDATRVPAHWLTFGARTSTLTASPRLSTNPANSLLNYLYSLLEGEATLAARIVGLDPGLGVLHADQLNRDSLSADLMEPVRPLVDRYVLRLLAERSFAASDFYETRQGVCRVTPPLARELALTGPDWGRAVGEVAEDVARLLDAGAGSIGPPPTPLTGRNRAAGRPGAAGRARAARPLASVRRRCAWCGAVAVQGRETCSAECLDALAAANRPAFVAAGIESLARLRVLGVRPEISDEGRKRIGTRTSESVSAARAWQRTHAWPTDMAEFEAEILPGLRDLPARTLAETTGLAIGYCRQVQKGAVRPHPMWWEALRALSDKPQVSGER